LKLLSQRRASRAAPLSLRHNEREMGGMHECGGSLRSGAAGGLPVREAESMPAASQGRPGRLTTHVLDTAAGRAAAGLTLELFRLDADGRRELIVRATTNADGRCDRPLLEGDHLRPGVYELLFHVGGYLRAQGLALPEPAFLDQVPIRFGVAAPGQHYHVPLLISPYGYSTYRGS
jgi:5-hydroxyisourate hydrolase